MIKHTYNAHNFNHPPIKYHLIEYIKYIYKNKAHRA